MPADPDNAGLKKSAARLANLIDVFARAHSALSAACRENPEAQRHVTALATALTGARLVVSELTVQIDALPVALPTTAATPAMPPKGPRRSCATWRLKLSRLLTMCSKASVRSCTRRSKFWFTSSSAACA